MPDIHDIQPLYSTLAADPEFGELIEWFVAEIPARLQALADFHAAGDWDELARYAHQLKGAAGGYGFPQITPYAKQLELAAKSRGDRTAIRHALDELTGVCRRIRAGRQMAC